MEANDTNVRTLVVTFIADSTTIPVIAPAAGCPCRLPSATGSGLLFVVLIINMFLAADVAIAAAATTAVAATSAAAAAAGELR